MDTDSFVLSVNTEDIIKDLKNFRDLFDFTNLSENQELFGKKNKKKENSKNKLKKYGLNNLFD